MHSSFTRSMLFCVALATAPSLLVQAAYNSDDLPGLVGEPGYEDYSKGPWKPYLAHGDPNAAVTVSWALSQIGCPGTFQKASDFASAKTMWQDECHKLDASAVAFIRQDTEAQTVKNNPNWAKVDCYLLVQAFRMPKEPEEPWKPYVRDGDPVNALTVSYVRGAEYCPGKFHGASNFVAAQALWAATCSKMNSQAKPFFRRDGEASQHKDGPWAKADCS
ncbi:hypothetical protein CBOM_07037 [Ceraceosorus bombacis]|uniref:Uncharacterized protein n=1 Tax=Ceraceosorus bombacis TaxID=401625 RepID=A0A0N7LAK4_9BASI|nr:hypothetical protein CBOM_07037 [Ceraceosorus bombacis]